ncbi:MAG: cyclase family protein [Bacteroidota bacterium]|nr:cyclase family protein [Bacteroidota bacterium]
MILKIEHHNKEWQINVEKFHDISIPINKTLNVNCYYLDEPAFSYYESPQFSGSLENGGSVNCEKISYYAHASGTHTECALHVLKVGFDMRNVLMPLLQLGVLLTIEPKEIGDEKVIDESFFEYLDNYNKANVIIVRTLPNKEDKKTINYSNTNPPYFTKASVELLKSKGFKHIITDLPSIDKESDEGKLAAHKAWFVENEKVPLDRTISELVYIANEIHDAHYFVSINFPKIETDAVPSSIVLYPII